MMSTEIVRKINYADYALGYVLIWHTADKHIEKRNGSISEVTKQHGDGSIGNCDGCG